MQVGIGNTSPNYTLHISKTQTETYSGNGEPDGNTKMTEDQHQ